MKTVRMLAASKANRPAIGIAAGTAAIWDAGVDGEDYTPAIAPASYLSKVKFHNALGYKKITRVVTSRDAGRAAVTLGAVGRGQVVPVDATLFAHGLGSTPLIIGEIEVGGYRQPVAGSAIPLPGGSVANPVPQCFIGLTSDATNIYMHVRGWIRPAMTVHWKVWVFAAEFQQDDVSDDLIRFTPSGALMAALGPIDTNHRFIRRKPGGAGEIRVLGQPTIAMDTQSNAMVLNYSDGVKSAAVWESDSTPYPVPHYAITGEECEIMGAPVAEAPGWRLEPPMMLVDEQGYKVFDTSQAMLAGLQRYKGSINTDPHPPLGGGYTSSFSIDRDIGAAPAGANMIFGWARVTQAGKFLPNNRPFEFSGTVILDGQSTYNGASWAQIINALIMVSPVIVGGRVVIREHGWSHSNASPPITGITIPSATIEYDLYAAAMVGGD